MHRSFTKKGIRNLLLISSSDVYGYEFLQYVAEDFQNFLKKNRVSKVLFIPYALFNFEQYLQQVDNALSKWGFNTDSIHKHENPQKAIEEAESIFVGGGNTFLLLRSMYQYNLLETIRKRVLEDGKPYIGTSAGSILATPSINTTNSMPIVYPPSFDALKLVPFNINPHYIDPDEKSTHKVQSREERILQYLEVDNIDKTVLAMREGAHLLVENDTAKLMGFSSSRLFKKDQVPKELSSGTDVSFLLQKK